MHRTGLMSASHVANDLLVVLCRQLLRCRHTTRAARCVLGCTLLLTTYLAHLPSVCRFAYSIPDTSPCCSLRTALLGMLGALLGLAGADALLCIRCALCWIAMRICRSRGSATPSTPNTRCQAGYIVPTVLCSLSTRSGKSAQGSATRPGLPAGLPRHACSVQLNHQPCWCRWGSTRTAPSRAWTWTSTTTLAAAWCGRCQKGHSDACFGRRAVPDCMRGWSWQMPRHSIAHKHCQLLSIRAMPALRTMNACHFSAEFVPVWQAFASADSTGTRNLLLLSALMLR
jgi:hypothetical protein